MRKRIVAGSGPAGGSRGGQPIRSAGPAWSASIARLADGVRDVCARDGVPWLVLAVIVAIAVRAAWMAYVNVDPNDGRLDDSVFYYNVGRFIAFAGHYQDPWQFQPTAAWPPGYPLILAAFFRLFGWHLVVAKTANLIFSAATVALVYLIARRLFNVRVAFLAALGLALFPGQVYFSTLLMTETVFAFIFALLVLLTISWTGGRLPSWWQVLVLGSVVGVAALVRSEGVLLAGLVVLFWCLVVRPWRLLLRYVPLLLVGAVIVIAPWTIRNAVQFHAFIPLRDGAQGTLSAGVNPDFSEADLDQLFVFLPRQRPIGESLRYWSAHPWEIPSFAWLKLKILYKNDQEGVTWAQNAPLYLSEREVHFWSTLSNWYLFGIGGLAILGTPLCLRGARKRQGMAILAFAVGWSAAFILFIPASRYHFPVGPLLPIPAAALAVTVWDRVAGSLGTVRSPRLPASAQRGGEAPE